MYINNCSYKRQGILFKLNKVDRDQIQRTGCLCKPRVLLSLYISWMHARYADVLDKKVKTLQVCVASLEKMSQEKSHNIFFPHLLYPGKS